MLTAYVRAIVTPPPGRGCAFAMIAGVGGCPGGVAQEVISFDENSVSLLFDFSTRIQ